MIEDEIFYANSTLKQIRVLGSNVKGTRLHIYINGKDISDTIDLQEVKITVDKPEVKPGA